MKHTYTPHLNRLERYLKELIQEIALMRRALTT